MRVVTTLLLPALLAICLPGAIHARSGAPPEALARQLPAWLEASGTPSAAVALVADGALQWTLVRGERSPGEPADARTLYNVASLTKPVTAEIAMRLVEAGRLGLDDRLAAHWVDPDLVDDPQLDQLTPRLCLSHQCGFPNWRRETEDKLAIQWPPGSRPGYSGEGYEYLARAMEQLSGQTLQQLAKTWVFEPAGMADSAYVQQPWFADRLALPHGPDGSLGEAALRSEASAADDLHATVADYAAFVAAILGGPAGPIEHQRWRIDHDVASQLCAPGRLEGDDCPRRMGFALGWVRFETATDTLLFHGGGDWGERAFVLMVPERKLGVVVFTNGAGGMAVIRDIVGLLYPNDQLDAFLAMQAGG